MSNSTPFTRWRDKQPQWMHTPLTVATIAVVLPCALVASPFYEAYKKPMHALLTMGRCTLALIVCALVPVVVIGIIFGLYGIDSLLYSPPPDACIYTYAHGNYVCGELAR